jgi:flagellar motor switch protein FliG
MNEGVEYENQVPATAPQPAVPVAAAPAKPKMSGVEKAAILMVVLGSDISARVLKYDFFDDEIVRITHQISALGQFPPERRRVVIEEFFELRKAKEYLVHGGIRYAKELLEKAMGVQRSSEIIKKLTVATQAAPFTALRKADPRKLLGFIKNEHPQAIALILSYLLPEQASYILSALPADLQGEVAKRIATIERTSTEVVAEVEQMLDRKLSLTLDEKSLAIGGVQSLVDILNAVDRHTEQVILEDLEKRDLELAEEVKRRLFVFEDITKMLDQSIQRVLREVDPKDLALALRGANEDVKKRIFKNMSQRAAQMLQEDLQVMGPVRLRDVETAQSRIVKIIRKLEEQNEIVVQRGGDDAIII